MRPQTYVLISIAIIAVFALLLFLTGQFWICECGYIKLWHGIAASSETSQHISDWYTFSHIIHGFAFYYFLLWLFGRFGRRPSLGLLLVLVLFLETGWEIIENTSWIIEYYRANTISLDYYGDSVINSVADVLAAIFGFILAYRLPVWVIIALAVAMELFVGFYIRDNLTLNILMFIYPFKTILNWQQGVF